MCFPISSFRYSTLEELVGLDSPNRYFESKMRYSVLIRMGSASRFLGSYGYYLSRNELFAVKKASKGGGKLSPK